MIAHLLSTINLFHIFSICSSIILSLLGITSIVVFHEFGHFIFCKIFKVYTPTFSIGMGKKIYKKMIGQTEFCLSAAPLGGYVEIAAQTTHEQKGFNDISYLKKCFIMLGGIACNMIFAYIIFSFLFYIGMPDTTSIPYENTTPVVKTITNTSKNYHHIQAEDTIINLNDQTINSSEEIKNVLNQAINENKHTLSATIIRNNQQLPITLEINLEKKQSTIDQILELTLHRKAPLSLQESIQHGVLLTHFYMKTIWNSLATIFSKKSGQNLAGPIVILTSSTKIAQKGIKFLLLFLAIMSINLGIMNLLPLPIFDGGQFVIFTIEALQKKEMSESVKEKIGMFSWILILTLMIVFSIKDIYTLIIQHFN
ncbi:MAG: M50 family metallopeptidase [Candidatus Chromulinivorax sp.]